MAGREAPFIAIPHPSPAHPRTGLRAGPMHCRMKSANFYALAALCWSCTHASPVVDSPKGIRAASFGTEDPVLLLDVDPKAEWVAICQSRGEAGKAAAPAYFGRHGDNRGSQLYPHIVLFSGPGERVSQYLGRDPTGQHLLVEKDGKLSLYDTRHRKERVLDQGAWDMESGLPVVNRRVARFDPSGRWVALLPKTDATADVVLLELSTMKQRQLHLGKGRVWNMGFSQDGRWFAADVIVDAHNGRFEFPHWVSTSRSNGLCYRGPNWEYDFDISGETRPVVVHLESDQIQWISDRVEFFGNKLLRSTPDGALVVQEADGSTHDLVPASCGGEVVVVAPEQQSVLVACGAREARTAIAALPAPPSLEENDKIWKRTARLYAFSLGRSKALEIAPYVTSHPGRTSIGRFGVVVELSEGLPSRIFDFETWEWVPLPHAKGTCDMLTPGFALQMVDGRTEAVSISNGERRFLSREVCSRSEQRGDYLLIGANLIHLPTMTRVGVHSRACFSSACETEPLYLGYDGRVLVAEHPSEGRYLPRGPLAWLSPQPVRGGE